ncbi:MAG: hypothetical protein JXM69_15635 [Anaerolineae bacterium]|nr:hypothetical protein [Anaerolineae bacterium]
MSGWLTLFWLIVSFGVMYPLKRWISSHVQGVAFLLTGSQKAAMWFFWVLFLPGTFLHELSHWLTAKLLRVKTGRFSLWPKQRRGQLQMGAVQVEVADPFRHSLIGLAPLIFGSMAILIIGLGRLELADLGQALSSGDLEVMGQALVKILSTPDVWLWLYLIFAISNAMLPSASDREAWWSVLIYLGLALFLAIGLGLNPALSPQIQAIGLTIIAHLLYAFVITIAVDLFFFLIILMIETFFAWVLGRQVQYHR